MSSVKTALRERQSRLRHLKTVKGNETRQERRDSQQEALTLKGNVSLFLYTNEANNLLKS